MNPLPQLLSALLVCLLGPADAPPAGPSRLAFDPASDMILLSLERGALPRLLDGSMLAALDGGDIPPERALEHLREKLFADIRELGPQGPTAEQLDAYAAKVTRFHFLANGWSPLSGPSVALVLEGPATADSQVLLERLEAGLENSEWAAARLVFDGDRPVTMTLLSHPRRGILTNTAVAAVGDTLILATSVPLARRVARRVLAAASAPADDAFGGLARFTANANQLSSAAMLAPGMMRMSNRAFTGAPFAWFDTLFDPSSMDVLDMALDSDGWRTRSGLSPDSDWRRWFTGGGFRHAPLAGGDALLAFNIGFGDARAFWAAMAERVQVLSHLADDRRGDGLPGRMLGELENRLGERVEDFFGLIREVGLRVEHPAADPAPPLALLAGASMTVRFADAAAAEGWWRTLSENWKPLPDLPAWPDAADADGVRVLTVDKGTPMPVTVAFRDSFMVVAMDRQRAVERAGIAAGAAAEDADAYGVYQANPAAILKALAPLVPRDDEFFDVDLLAPMFGNTLRGATRIDADGVSAAAQVDDSFAMVRGYLTGLFMPVLASARQAARQAVSLSNLKQIGLYIIMYANDHRDRMPPDLATVKAQFEPNFDERIFSCPVTGAPYTYVAEMTNREMGKLPLGSRTIMVYSEMFPRTRRRVAVFADGHAETLTEAMFQQRLEETRRLLADQPAPVAPLAAEEEEVF